jgi:hypothetical protein
VELASCEAAAAAVVASRASSSAPCSAKKLALQAAPQMVRGSVAERVTAVAAGTKRMEPAGRRRDRPHAGVSVSASAKAHKRGSPHARGLGLVPLGARGACLRANRTPHSKRAHVILHVLHNSYPLSV